MADFTPGSLTSVAQNTVVSKLASPTFNLGNTTVASGTASTSGLSTLGLSAQTSVSSAISSSVTDTATALQTAKILSDATDATWQPNVLSSVSQSTYHIKFYMTQDKAINFSQMKSWADAKAAIAALKQTVIAESGVTGLSIQSMVIDSIPSTNGVTRSVSATKITMVIQEPMGVSFFDLLAQSAQDLGIQNYAKCWYYVEVSFKGYDTNGGFTLNPCIDMPNGGVWLYRLGITDVNVTANAAGSTYTIEFMPIEEDIFNTTDLKLPFPFAPKGGTIGDMLNELADGLNNSNLRMYGQNTMTYNFKVAPFKMNGQTVDPSKWKLVPSDINISYADVRSLSLGSVDGVDEKTSIHGYFPMGMNITDVIEMMFVSCQSACQYARDVQQPDKLDKDDKSWRNCIIFRHEPSVDIGAYLPTIEQYQKNITFTTLSYFTNKPIVSPQDIDVAKDSTNQQKQAQTYMGSGYLSKRYDYMFTGLNTEVLNFDFKFKLNWAAVLPQVLGYQASTASVVDHAMARPDAQDNKAILTQIQDLDQKVNLAQQKVYQDQSAVDDANKALSSATSKNDSSAISSAKDALSTATSQLNSDQAALDKLKQQSSTVGALLKNVQQQTAADNSKLQVQGNANQPALTYAEDELSNVGTVRYPITIRQAPNTYDKGNIAPQYTRDRSIYGAILDQVYGAMDSDLQKVTLSIKGDPYWLGAGNLERTVNRSVTFSTPRDNLGSNVVSNKQVDYTFGDMMFLIAFKYPLGISPNGSPMIKYNESFTGIYKITQVTHMFDNGIFKQDLIGVRQPLNDAFKAFGFSTSATASTTASTTSSSTPATTSTVSGSTTSSVGKSS